jgi:predicted permease
MPDPLSTYRKLLRLFPAAFREEYAAPMEHMFRDEHREATTRREQARLWLRAFADVLISAPRQRGLELRQDLRFAIRVYLRRPVSAVLAVSALALAIGVCTGVFSVVNALLLRSLPFSDASRLVELRLTSFTAGMGRASFLAWRDHNSYLADAVAFSTSEMNLDAGRDALRVSVCESSANFFSLLGTGSSIGRTFAPGEDKAGQTHVAVISHRLWQQAYGGDPAVLNSVVHINGAPLSIIGVAPPRMDYPNKTDVWTPSVFDFETIPKHGAFLFQTIGRLQSGTTFSRAQQQFNAEALHANPESSRSAATERPQLVRLRDQITAQVRQSVLILCAVVLCVLMTACANVAQLLLSRTTERRQELALRSALGASRSRLVQQLITEASALTFAGAVFGLAIAFGVARLAGAALPATLATQTYTLLDWRVLSFAIALAILVGVIFGVIPASIIGRLQPSTQLARVQPGASEPATRRLRSTLVVVQVALTFALLASSITLGRAFLRLLGSDLGFSTGHVVTLNVSLQGMTHKTASSQWQYYSAVLERLRAIPGVDSAGAVHYLPLADNVYMAGSVKLDSGQPVSRVILNGVMPGYFQAMRTRLIAGREFTMNESTSPEPPVIVNEAFAREAGQGSALLGRKIIAPWNSRPYLIAGVVATSRIAGPEYEGGPQVYWPVQEEPGPSLTFVIRVRGDASAYLSRCRDAVSAIDPAVPVYQVQTLDQRLSETLTQPRFYTISIFFLGSVSLLLAIIGVYGTSTYVIAQRRHELGIRMALGAVPVQVRTMMLRQGLAPVGAGLAAGIILALWCGRFFTRLFVGATVPGIVAYAAASASLLLIAMLAAWSSTARILAINPVEAIRAE